MLRERPSQRKVVGVAYKYLQHQEALHTLDDNLARFQTKDLSPEMATYIGTSIGFSACMALISRPLQTRRETFLYHAREVEGFAPGEESLAVYALNKFTKREQEKFPQTLRAHSTRDSE